MIAWPRRGRLWLLVGQVACLATIVLAGQAVFTRLAGKAERRAARSPAGTAAGVRAVMVAGLTLRHRPDCPLVAGKDVVPATADAAPCGWCSP